MKVNLLSLFFLCSILMSFAQNSDYYDRMEHVFGNIDKNKVTTGYLKEFGVRFNQVENYNGVINSNNFVDKTQWQSLYNSLYSMRVGNIASSMINPSSVNTALQSQKASSSVDVLFATQYYSYQQYKSNAATNGDVTIINDQIYDVSGRNPYEIKTIFGVTPLSTELEGNTFSFKLSSSLIYTNTSLTLSQVQMDFGDGQGYQTVALDSIMNVSYVSGGEKEIKVKFVYSGGPTLYSHSKIFINYIAPTGQARFNGTGTTTHFMTGASYLGATSSGLITVETAGSDGVLDKPLIVVEGFDPKNDFNYSNLINRIGPGGINIPINQGSGLTLNEAIEVEGYDLVFINFINSTDYIQRNAYMVEAVIAWVNAQKALNSSIEKNVVLGMSMGGLVARYALRHMEVDGDPSTNHDTKLYISHDTPHQGANVPLAYQAMLRHLVGTEISLPNFLGIFGVDDVNLADEIPALEDALTLLQSPAAQQMLVYQLQGTGSSVSVNNNSLYSSFATEYKNLGYPVQGNIRNIAIANGAECGTSLDFDAYDPLVDIDVEIDVPFFVSNIAVGILNGLSANPLQIISSAFSTDTDIKARFLLRALPNKQVKQIYSGKLFIEKTILFVITVEEDLIDQEIVSSTSSMLALDNAAGGFYDIEKFVTLPTILNNYVLEKQFNFIPSYSSLDIGKGNQVITARDLNKVYSPLAPPIAPKDTPFDNFFTNPSISENHIQFTLNNGNWLMAELSGTPQLFSCSSSCVEQLSLAIVGEDQVCSSETYTLNNLATGVPITWTIDSPGAFNLVANGNIVTVNSLGLVNGAVTLTATVATDCNNIVKEKIIYAGAQRPMLLDNTGNEIAHIEACVNIHHGISFDTPPGAVDWEWNKVSGNFNLMANNNNYGTVFSYQPASGIISVRLKDDCGWSPPTFLTVNISNCASGNFQYMASPNPASDVLNISQTNQASSLNMSSESFALGESNNEVSSSATLFDFNGNPVQTISPAIGSMNVQSLSPGHYILVVTYGESSESHHILIE